MSSLGVGYPFPLHQTMDNGSNTFTLAPYNIGGMLPSNVSGQIVVPAGATQCPLPSQIDSNMSYNMCVALSRQCQADGTEFIYESFSLRSLQSWSFPHEQAFQSRG